MNSYCKENKGTITLGEKVMVSDPCYGLNTWCQGTLENVLPGQYECHVGFSDEGDWGTRVADIEAIHKDYVGVFIDFNLEDIYVGVDSGQAGIFDYAYYEKYHTDAKERNHVNDEWYDKVCKLTHTDKLDGNIIDSLSFVSSAGYGDGMYKCWTAKNKDGKVIAIALEFIGEYDDEEE